jgi:hypothetical protein
MDVSNRHLKEHKKKGAIRLPKYLKTILI